MKASPFLVTILIAAAARADLILSPGSVNSASAIPFFTRTDQTASVRYQQVYAASDFSHRVAGPVAITEIAFTGGSGSGTINTLLANIQIDFSTTQKFPDGLSSRFSENLGQDDTIVYSGPLHLSVVQMESYGIHIPLQHPFLFDPSVGNLLMDVRNFQTMPPPSFGGQPLLGIEDRLADTVSSAVSFNVNSPTADLFVNSSGLSTLFTVTEVPEPAVPVIGAAMFVALLFGVIRKTSSCR